MSSAEVCEQTGATYRQLDYWVRKGLLGKRPDRQQGSGSRREFTARELDVLTALVAFAEVVGRDRHAPYERIATHVRAHGLTGSVELAPHVVLILDGLDGGNARAGGSNPRPASSARAPSRQVVPRFKKAKK